MSAVAFGDAIAVDDVSLEIRRGETVALLGPNGAGKTTLLEMMLGLRRPDRGAIRVLGASTARATAGGRVGAMLQEGGLPPGARVAELVDLVRRLYPRPLALAEALRLPGLEPLAKRRVEGLAGGEQQRVRLALALAGRPELLVLDEPTAAMDVAARRSFCPPPPATWPAGARSCSPPIAWKRPTRSPTGSSSWRGARRRGRPARGGEGRRRRLEHRALRRRGRAARDARAAARSRGGRNDPLARDPAHQRPEPNRPSAHGRRSCAAGAGGDRLPPNAAGELGWAAARGDAVPLSAVAVVSVWTAALSALAALAWRRRAALR